MDLTECLFSPCLPRVILAVPAVLAVGLSPHMGTVHNNNKHMWTGLPTPLGCKAISEFAQTWPGPARPHSGRRSSNHGWKQSWALGCFGCASCPTKSNSQIFERLSIIDVLAVLPIYAHSGLGWAKAVIWEANISFWSLYSSSSIPREQ